MPISTCIAGRRLFMLPVVQARWDAMELTRQVRKSLLNPRHRWATSGDEDGNSVLSHGDFRIELVPRRARLFDSIHLYKNDAEIWLPLLSRIRLRAAARLRLIQQANKSAETLTSRRAPRASNRKRRVRAS
jgi:hypothetical protein